MIRDSIDFIEQLNRKAKDAAQSKYKKVFSNTSYFPLIIYKKILFPFLKYSWNKQVKTFYHKDLKVRFPGNFDIAFYGIKVHDSEVRLAKYMIRHLKKGQTFLDIGAHIGYFSLLASVLLKDNGYVIAIEPSKNTYRILQENMENESNLQIYNLAVSDQNGQQLFLDYPTRSEDNRLFRKEDLRSIGKTYEISTLTLDSLIMEKQIQPSVIKIDVEGAEDKVIKGGATYFEMNNPIVIMEILQTTEKTPYWSAMNMLKKWDYQMYKILEDGELSVISDRESYYESLEDSDNVVFVKAPN